jgi:hypothetical protein
VSSLLTSISCAVRTTRINLVHGSRHTFLDCEEDRIGCPGNHFPHDVLLGRVKPAQHVPDQSILPAPAADANSKSGKLFTAQPCENRPQPIVASRAAPGAKTDPAQGQIDVVNYDQHLLGSYSSPPLQTGSRIAAPVHVPLRLDQKEFLIANRHCA